MTSEAGPSATIVIPTYNRPERLAQCLTALAALRGSVEIVVVDDGSAQDLAPVVAAHAPEARLLRQENRGPAAARNRGARAARAPFVAFTDDDCTPDPGWIEALLAAHGEAPEALLGGRVHNRASGVYAAASQALCDHLYASFREGGGGGQAAFFTSNNLGCDRARFIEIGGFDESFPLAAAEDRELAIRWRERGGTLRYCAAAAVGHHHAMGVRGFLRQHANYGRGARHLHRVLTGRRSAPPRFAGLGFYAGLVTHPLRDGLRDGLALSALLLLSQVAMVAGYLREALAGRPRRGSGVARAR